MLACILLNGPMVIILAHIFHRRQRSPKCPASESIRKKCIYPIYNTVNFLYQVHFLQNIYRELWVSSSDISHAPSFLHDDVIKWKHFPCNWPLLWGIHRSPVNFPLKGQWRGALMFSLIYAWINGWVNKGVAGDLRCYRAHHDGIVMTCSAGPRANELGCMRYILNKLHIPCWVHILYNQYDFSRGVLY